MIGRSGAWFGIVWTLRPGVVSRADLFACRRGFMEHAKNETCTEYEPSSGRRQNLCKSVGNSRNERHYPPMNPVIPIHKMAKPVWCCRLINVSPIGGGSYLGSPYTTAPAGSSPLKLTTLVISGLSIAAKYTAALIVMIARMRSKASRVLRCISLRVFTYSPLPS